jgi:hypothetical protein
MTPEPGRSGGRRVFPAGSDSRQSLAGAALALCTQSTTNRARHAPASGRLAGAEVESAGLRRWEAVDAGAAPPLSRDRSSALSTRSRSAALRSSARVLEEAVGAVSSGLERDSYGVHSVGGLRRPVIGANVGRLLFATRRERVERARHLEHDLERKLFRSSVAGVARTISPRSGERVSDASRLLPTAAHPCRGGRERGGCGRSLDPAEVSRDIAYSRSPAASRASASVRKLRTRASFP